MDERWNGAEHVGSVEPLEPARRPEDLNRFFVDRVNANDLEALAALYEAEAVLAFPPGALTRGEPAIRETLERFLATGPTLPTGDYRPAILFEDLALTSTRERSGIVTAEVARRQADGSWRGVIDQPDVLGRVVG